MHVCMYANPSTLIQKTLSILSWVFWVGSGVSTWSVHGRKGLVGARIDPDTPGTCVCYLSFKKK